MVPLKILIAPIYHNITEARYFPDHERTINIPKFIFAVYKLD